MSRPTEIQAGELAKRFTSLRSLIDITIPDSREKSVALTNLDTGYLWAKEALYKKGDK
jgi:hypothetical protein